MGSFKWLWQNLKGRRILLFIGLGMVLATSALSMVNPYMSGIIVDRVILGGDKSMLLPLLGILVGVTLLKTLVRYSFSMIFETISLGVMISIREKLYIKIQELDFGFFDKNRTGDIMAKMTGDLDMVRHFLAASMYLIFEKVMIFIFAITILFSINVPFAFILLLITPFIGFFTYKMAKDVKPTFSEIREQFSRLNSVVQENISGNRVVKAFAKEKYEIEKFSKENDEYRMKNMISARVWEKYLPILESLAGTLSIVLILAGGIFVIRGALTMGELVTFSSFIWALNDPMRMAGWLINDVQRFAASAEKVMELLNTYPRIKNTENPIQKETLQGSVEFRDVNFRYGDEKVLEGINFSVKPGQTVAILGATGSGKSTLVSLISRFYDCSSGVVRIDGVNVKDMEIQTLRSKVSVAMQDIFLFSDTIEGNIAYGVPDATLEQVKWAAKVADAHHFISGFAEGYDTIVGERGVGLSGGQKQRIALARALLKNPSIIILDDTTSSVDIETEHEIHKTLKSYYKDKTTFIIAHRISSVKNADMILVLERGKIVEQGKHEELVANQGYYYNVYINQYGDFDQTNQAEVG